MVTSAQASANILAAKAANLLRQGVFRETDASGATYVNILGAMDTTVLSAEDTPTDVMPVWMGYLCASLFDKMEFVDALSWTERIATQMATAEWPNIEWDDVKLPLLLSAMDEASMQGDASENADRVSLPTLYIQARSAVATQTGLTGAINLGLMVAQTTTGVALSAVNAMLWACKSPLAPAVGLATTMANMGVDACQAAAANAVARGRPISSLRSQHAALLCRLIDQQI